MGQNADGMSTLKIRTESVKFYVQRLVDVLRNKMCKNFNF